MFLNPIKLNRFISTLLVIACIIHIGYIVYFILNPDYPIPRQYKKALKDIEFPVSFQICVNEINFTDEKYQKFGYDGLWNYFKGESRYNSSLVGWAGHKQNYSMETFGSVEG